MEAHNRTRLSPEITSFQTIPIWLNTCSFDTSTLQSVFVDKIWHQGLRDTHSSNYKYTGEHIQVQCSFKWCQITTLAVSKPQHKTSNRNFKWVQSKQPYFLDSKTLLILNYTLDLARSFQKQKTHHYFTCALKGSYMSTERSILIFKTLNWDIFEEIQSSEWLLLQQQSLTHLERVGRKAREV